MASLRFASRVAGALCLAACGLASAAPVQFSVTPVGFLPGLGYGVDSSELAGTLLDVSFAQTGSPQNFTLANVGDSFTFEFGTVVFQEGGQIRSEETDDLAVAAQFSFTDPLAGQRFVLASGEAFIGPVVDALVDFTISWNTRQIAFGDGGLFEISMNSVNFRQEGAQRIQNATITLLAQPLPEPAGLALAATALVAAGAATRRRRG